MIADAHAHAWPSWPYPGTGHADADALLREMDAVGVERALLVAARIGAPGDEDDNSYLAHATHLHLDRFDLAIEIDGRWSVEHGMPGAVDRFERWIGTAGLAAVALYPHVDEIDWLESTGTELVAVAASAALAVSLAATPAHYATIARIAEAIPEARILLHHLGLPRVGELDEDLRALGELVRTYPGVHVKLSGPWYADPTRAPEGMIGHALATLPADRLLWGSDAPAARRFGVDYAASLALLDALDPALRPEVAGGNYARLIRAAS